MMLTLLITSKGIAAVPRASLVVLSGTLTAFGLPLEGVAVILGVDELMDMARTMVNLVGNCLATAVMARWEGELGHRSASGGRAQAADGRGSPDRGRSDAPRALSGGPLEPIVPLVSPSLEVIDTHRIATCRCSTAAGSRWPSSRCRSRQRAAAARRRRRPATRAPPRSPTCATRSPSTPPRAQTRTLKVAMSFDVAGPGPVLLSLPAWTPGAYELSFFARWVSNFTADGRATGRWPGTSSTTTPGGSSPAGAKSVTRPVRLPGRHARQRDGLGPARLRAVQRHQRPALSRGPRLRTSPRRSR